MSNLQLTRKDDSNQTDPRSGTLPPLDDICYFIEGFVLKHRSQRHSPRTIEFYKENLLRFVWFLEHEGYPTTLADISPNSIRHFFIYLNETAEQRWGSSRWGANRPLSPSTIHAFARTLRAFFRWSTKEARLQFNPFANIDMPRVPSQWKVETYTDEEIAQLLAACETFGLPFTAQRNRSILAMLLDSGIRASELLGLEVEDIDPREGSFSVRGKGSKERPVVIGNFARRELWAYLTHFRLKMDTPSSALFVSHTGAPLTYDGLRYIFKQLKTKSGITRISIRAHICRHTFATIAHRNGMRGSTLQEALGHTMFDTTRRYYLDISKEDLKAEHALYGPLDNMNRELRLQNNSTLQAGSGLRHQNTKAFATSIPSADVLAAEVKQSGFVAVGRKYGVSDNAIRKRLKKAGLL